MRVHAMVAPICSRKRATFRGARLWGLTWVMRYAWEGCRVVWPRAFSDAGGNADSLCLLVSYENEAGPLTALLTGDAEAEQIEKMVQSGGTGSSEAVAVNVLKAGHHGSKAGMTPKLAQGLSANIALVSCGANNRYGHPAQATRVFRTDELGDIACVFSREGIEVRPQYASGVALE